MTQMNGLDTNQGMEIGLYSLGDYMGDIVSGKKESEGERIKGIVRAAKMAEDAGLDVFSLGESHQRHFISQAHQVILGAIAQATSRIKLTSGATILSTADPVRVFEEFSTLDLLSDGRVEIIAGRASRTGVYDLMGVSLQDYDAIFEEKFNLLLQLNREKLINWKGEFRPELRNAEMLPRPFRDTLPIWRAVGGSPASAVKAGLAGVPMTLATLAGPSVSFKQSVDNYRMTLEKSGFDAKVFPVA